MRCPNCHDEELAFLLGVERFIRKPFEPDKFIKIIQSVISDVKKGTVEPKKPICKEEKEILKLYSERLVNKLENKILDLEKEITEHKKAEEELKQSYEKLQKALDGIIHTIALTVETRDPYTAGHQKRVAKLASAIAIEMGFTEEQVEGIFMAGIIHDLGKISVPAEILSKPTKLTDNEFNLIKNHSQLGYNILKDIDFPWPIAQIVLQHHERMDGSGYPQGLSDENILIKARILGVADVVEAMSFHRPYRPALGIDKALEEIKKNKGILYDPKVADVCLKLFSEKRFKFE